MNMTRREFFGLAAASAVAVAFLPRAAFAAASNSLRAVRTGKQIDKTRIVIETAKKPSYSLAYPAGALEITLKDTDGSAAPEMASGTLVSNITVAASGGDTVVKAALSRPIYEIPKKQTMILEPGGSNKNYRLVLDFGADGEESGAAAPVATKQNDKKIIVLDAGHGGKDPGTIGKNMKIKEKDIVLKVARKLRDSLNGQYRVYLTRDKDEFLNLNTRAAFAESKGADLFISLHANANPSKKTQGFSTYTLSKKASDEEAMKTAEAENAADRIAVDNFQKFEQEIRMALSSLQQQVVAESSVAFGSNLVKTTKSSGIKLQDNPLRYAPFAVLKSSVPSVLVELGHLSNAEEEKLLNSDPHQNKLVSVIKKAIDNFEFLS
ncbi:MAG: N-acetylmuramoyl-L-alanine amidase [Rickettsiales bacterium]|jgi:N-acetylmuramoyl-L-alanine amidase|nr:N-acetylmuramoyl-L-alanine amidase [Rickettsiales bacterium]